MWDGKSFFYVIVVVVVIVILRHCPSEKKREREKMLKTYKHDDKIENGPKAGKIPGET